MFSVEVKVTPGTDGCRLWVDGIVMRSGLTPTQAMEARGEARRLVMVGAHDALGMLAATLALGRPA